MVDFRNNHDNSEEVGFYSDASAAKKLGFGAILKFHWIQGMWPEGFIERESPSIKYLEFFALCMGVMMWQEHLANQRFCIHCDNMAVVHMINGMTAKCKNCMFLLRLLTLNNLKFNRSLSAHYINTKMNQLSDALSRNQMTRFRKLEP